jgi:3-hydroxymyristoyl/3-hydroxydecanoyl-(acyl carrier protein) dehydratase
MSASALSLDACLAHRPPFRFVDAVESVGEGGGECRLVLAVDDARLQHGALPSCLLLEALFQAAAALRGACKAEGQRPEIGVLASLEQARFYGTARAGDCVRLSITPGPTLGALARLSGQARRGHGGDAGAGELLAEATWTVARG